MNHIKLYEYYKESYYEEISSDEYSIMSSGDIDFSKEEEDDFISKNWEKFTKSEINKIMEYFPKKYKPSQEIEGRLIINKGDDEVILIIKLKDEWFLLYDLQWQDVTNDESEVYYKCDQFDGLKKLLIDNEYNKENIYETATKLRKKI